MGCLRYCLLEAFAGVAPSVLVEGRSPLRRAWLARGAWFVKIVSTVVVFVLSLAVAPTTQAQNKTAQSWREWRIAHVAEWVDRLPEVVAERTAEWVALDPGFEARVAEFQAKVILDDFVALEREAPRVCESVRVTVKLRERQHREMQHLFKGVDLEEFPYMTASHFKALEEGCRELLATVSEWNDEFSDEYASFTGDELTEVWRDSDGQSHVSLTILKRNASELMGTFCRAATEQSNLLKIERKYGLSGVPRGMRLLADKAAGLGQAAKDTICPLERRGVYKFAPDGSRLSDN